MKFINGIRHISKKDTAAGFINFRLTFPFHARTGPTEKTDVHIEMIEAPDLIIYPAPFQLGSS